MVARVEVPVATRLVVVAFVAIRLVIVPFVAVKVVKIAVTPEMKLE